jgi:alkanesulfonate monooxygenase SsuD/methylene tetrahydromethanopterin reductase-like flavin-dependent oxidoreductase (luciferase family)
VRKHAEAFREESRQAGRELNLGEQIGVIRCVYLAQNREAARELARQGACGVAFHNFFHHFGFTEAFREPQDEQRYGNRPLPQSELSVERMERAKFALTGNTDDVRREMDALVENIHPEWFMWQSDQGLLPIEIVKQELETFGRNFVQRYK